MKLTDIIARTVTLAAGGGLLVSYASPYIDPNDFVLPSLLGLAYPYLLLANLILLVYWLLRRKHTALLELAVLLAGIPSFVTYYGTAGKQEGAAEADLSILSYNVRYFDCYRWSEKSNTAEELFRYLNSFKGDVICLQEFSLKQDSRENGRIIRELRSYPYHFIHRGIAIFSRLPLHDPKVVPFDPHSTGRGICCTLKKGQKSVRIYNVHLESYKLGKQESQLLKDLGRNLRPDRARNLVRRLVQGNRNRAEQADILRRHLAASGLKTILCGDFNSTPISYTYRTISRGLEDSFIERGRGLGNTYIGDFPSFRIDYILHSPGICTKAYNREEIRLSDHYPVRADLSFEKI